MFVAAFNDRSSYVQHLRTKLTSGFDERWLYVDTIATERPSLATPLPASSHLPLYHHYRQQQQVYEQTGTIIIRFSKRTN